MLPLVLLLLLSEPGRPVPGWLASPCLPLSPSRLPPCLTGVPTAHPLLCLSPVLYAPRCPAALPACESLPLPFCLSLSLFLSLPAHAAWCAPARRRRRLSCRSSPAPLSATTAAPARPGSAAPTATSERPRAPPPLRPPDLPRPLPSLPARLLGGTAAVCLSLSVGLCGILLLRRTAACTQPPSPAGSRETKQPADANEEEARSYPPTPRYALPISPQPKNTGEKRGPRSPENSFGEGVGRVFLITIFAGES